MGSGNCRKLLGGSQELVHLWGKFLGNHLNSCQVSIVSRHSWLEKEKLDPGLDSSHDTISNSNNCKFNKTMGFQETLLHSSVKAWSRIITGKQMNLQQGGRRKISFKQRTRVSRGEEEMRTNKGILNGLEFHLQGHQERM